MRLVENSYYDHDEHGRLKLMYVGKRRVGYSIERSARVEFDLKDEFRKKAEPADIRIETPKNDVNSDTPNPT